MFRIVQRTPHQHLVASLLGVIPFTPSKQYDVACLKDIRFDPKTKSITWRTEKTLKVGTQPPMTTVTERTVMKNVEEQPKQLASMGIENAYTNAHNIDKLTETIEQYKGKMVEMKEVLRKEERVGQESKRKYEATLSNFDKVASYFLFDSHPTLSSFLKTSFISAIFPLYFSMVYVSLSIL